MAQDKLQAYRIEIQVNFLPAFERLYMRQVRIVSYDSSDKITDIRENLLRDSAVKSWIADVIKEAV